MPTRAPTSRTTRTVRAPRKRTTPSVSEPPAPPPPPPPPAVYSPLQTTIATAFSSAQKTTAGHRKLAINLRSVWEQCATGTGSVGAPIGGGRAGEKAFVKEFTGFLNRALVVKKSEVVGDRCLRFVDLFVRGLLDKGEYSRLISTANASNLFPINR